MDLDLFILEPVQGQTQGNFTYLANDYRSLEFQDDSGKPLHIRPFLKQHFLQKLRQPTASPTTDHNVNALNNLNAILDDLKARRIAQTLGLQVTGTLGILLQAKQTGLLPSVRAAISTLEKQKDKMPGFLSSKRS